MEIKPNLTIRRPSPIREKVRKAIRNDILDGRIPPGARLVEARLANEIKVSRTPVREALHMLEMEGLLEVIPRVGYRVRELSWRELEEICQIRAVNETLAGRWAMEKITPRQIRALEDNLSATEEGAEKGDTKTFLDLDAEFHEIIARSSGSKRLLELCQLLRRHMLRYRIESLYLSRTDFRHMALKSVAGHRRILDCIKSRDSQCIEEAVHRHLDETRASIQHYTSKKRPADKPGSPKKPVEDQKPVTE